MTKRWGAEAEDWVRLDLLCGLTEDLLPVVSNPEATISSLSKMKKLGKTPSVYNRSGLVAGVADWTQYKATSADINKWSKDSDYGICIQTRDIRAIDIDLECMEQAQLVYDRVSLGQPLGPLPLRWRNGNSKCLLAFRCKAVESGLRKRTIRCSKGIVEFLGDGNQFIAHGTHPSGARYEWDWNGHADFPELTLEEFEALWAALVKEFSVEPVSLVVNNDTRHGKDVPGLGTDDPVMDTLSVLELGREGQAYIECPFKADHTMDSGVTETAYFPAGTRGYEQGHFVCLHAHCENKTDQNFLDALGIRQAEFEPILEEPERKVFNIRIKGGNLPEELEIAEEALLAAQVPYYQRGSSIVRPVIEKMKASGGRTTLVVQLVEVDTPYLRHDLCKAATWLKSDGKKWKKINAPTEMATHILSNFGNWKFPKVIGVSATPTLRPDGSLLCKEGFDESTGLLLVDMPRMPEIPESPTQAQALTALHLLKSLLVEFPFVSTVDRAVALSALITPIVRGAFPVAPMHVVRAPTPGSGKSFLLDIASAMAIGQPCPVMAAGRSEEETEKRLGAALLCGQPIINLDNVNGTLGGDFLCQLIERPIVEVRILGKSQIVKIEARSTIYATGNNIVLPGDMNRRVVLCMLDANIERPELREFAGDPVQKVLKERGKYIAAALTVVRGYLAAGSPDKASNIASFTEWSDLVRSSLMWLGEADPVISMETARQEDPILTSMLTIFNSMRECIGVNKPMTAAQILKVAEYGDGFIADAENLKYENFHEALLNTIGMPNGQMTSKSLGRWLSSRKDRIVGGLRLHGKLDKHTKFTVWWVSEEDTHNLA